MFQIRLQAAPLLPPPLWYERAATHQGHLRATRLCQLQLFKSGLCFYWWHYTQWQSNPMCSHGPTPPPPPPPPTTRLPGNHLCLWAFGCMSGRGPRGHGGSSGEYNKEKKTEQLLRVLIKMRASLQLVTGRARAPLPRCSNPPPSLQRAGSGTRSQAPGRPRKPPVAAHLRAVISHVICPDSVCSRTSRRSTGHWEELPRGDRYENSHLSLPNIIVVTARGDRRRGESEAAPRQFRWGLQQVWNLLLAAFTRTSVPRLWALSWFCYHTVYGVYRHTEKQWHSWINDKY